MAAAALSRTASRGAPRSPARMARLMRAFSAGSPPTMADSGALGRPKSFASIRSLVMTSFPRERMVVVVASVISSSPSSPRKTKPSQPLSANTCAITKCIRSLATPTAAAFGLAGLASGPKILKTVETPSSFRAGAANRIAG